MQRPYDSWMTRSDALDRGRRVELGLTVLGCALVVAALVIIWIARLTATRDLYVSEMGASGEPSAAWFRVALLLVVAGGSLVAWAGRDIRSRVRILKLWAPAVSLWVACGFFLVASQVTCTPGCPPPIGATFDVQDLVHTVCAVLAFGLSCWAMLQTSFARGHRALAITSLWSAIAVAIIAGAGGLMSLFRFNANFGSRLELVATTIGLGWLVVFGVFVAVERARERPGVEEPLSAVRA